MAMKIAGRVAIAASAATIALAPFAGLAQAQDKNVEVGFEDTVDVGPGLPTGQGGSDSKGPAVVGPSKESPAPAPAPAPKAESPAPAPAPKVESPAPAPAPQAEAPAPAPAPAPAEGEGKPMENVVVDDADDVQEDAPAPAPVESPSDQDETADDNASANTGSAAYDSGNLYAPQLAQTGAPLLGFAGAGIASAFAAGFASRTRRNK